MRGANVKYFQCFTPREISRALDTLLPEYQLTRKDIFLTTKIPVGPLEAGGASLADCRAGLDQMLEELATEYLDLLLIHSPPATEETRREAWQCLEQFYRDGKTRAVGETLKPSDHFTMCYC